MYLVMEGKDLKTPIDFYLHFQTQERTTTHYTKQPDDSLMRKRIRLSNARNHARLHCANTEKTDHTFKHDCPVRWRTLALAHTRLVV